MSKLFDNTDRRERNSLSIHLTVTNSLLTLLTCNVLNIPKDLRCEMTSLAKILREFWANKRFNYVTHSLID